VKEHAIELRIEPRRGLLRTELRGSANAALRSVHGSPIPLAHRHERATDASRRSRGASP
jgi:hypothetical protein